MAEARGAASLASDDTAAAPHTLAQAETASSKSSSALDKETEAEKETSQDDERDEDKRRAQEIRDQELEQQAVDEGHDADIPSSIGYVLDERGEAKRRKSIADRSRPTTAKGASKETATAVADADVEKGLAGDAKPDGDASGQDEEQEHDPNVVWWDGPDDPQNPFNWPTWHKALNCTLISALTFVTPLASSIFAPGVPALMAEFHSDSNELAAFVVSVYVLGFAFGPLLIAPLSEIYGRNIVYHVCNVCFIAFVVGCALAPSLNTLIAFRFLSGVFGSCPLTNGGGSIADMVSQEHRGAAMASFAVGPLLGPIIGPVAGGFLASAKGWRWVFWLLVILSGFLSVVFFFSMRETYAPLLLERKARRLRKETGNPLLRSKLDAGLTSADYFQRGIFRPLKMLAFSPIVLIFALYMAVVYGYLYLMFTSVTEVFQSTYGFGTNTVGLVYLGLGVGSMAGMVFFSAMSDRYTRRMAAKEGQGMKPEYRLQMLPLAAVLLPIGFFIYGWTAEYHKHWIAPILGMVVIGFANLVIFMSLQLYLVDAFTIYAASALAANTVVRSIAGAVLPLAGLQMYAKLGLGWGNSLLGFIALALVPAPFFINKYGEYLRKRFEIKDL
ncbi:Major Facilitator Superfamily protein [Sporothrix brasiliensis 5110]|uniref:Major Facilitator Superfamily protein n=1 Tax=Sporothrix brasiliensis 5110 TaxID=1398154 RepID=A0A0C2FGP9_9PEZI|nr:Major Facilitator Superfamily protein [Sporothrix brasiliensis 5110]KIH90238.1 Major Facilitator Superfamily protein [Sporothrix brasiliensis 5110]